VLETYGSYALLAGLAILVIAWFWLVIRAFKVRFWWGLGVLLFPPLVLLFLLLHGRKARAPLVAMLLGCVAIAVPLAINYYERAFVDLGPRERVVDGELHITLTGWDGKDYSILQARPQTVVLQMANPDVTDQTLEFLRPMAQLRELDLNDTQITDEGLRTLSELPRLETLRLRATPITDEGFRQSLLPKESLQELDLRETKVASKTVREWKTAKPDRKALR
jgi:hypothetical protein